MCDIILQSIAAFNTVVPSKQLPDNHLSKARSLYTSFASFRSSLKTHLFKLAYA